MYSTRNLISDVWLYVKPYQRSFWVATFLRAVCDLVWLYPAYGLAAIVNFLSRYTMGQPLTSLYFNFSLLIAAFAIRHVAMYFAKSTMYRISERIVLDAQLRSMRHMTLLDMAWHEKENSGNKFKRLDRGATSLDRLLRIWVANIIEISINLVGVVLILFRFDLAIGFAVFLFLATFYFLAQFYRKKAVAASDIVNAKEETRSGLLFETINNIRSVKAMSMADKILSLLSANTKDLMESIRHRIYWFQSGNAIRNLYAHAFRIGAMIIIVHGILHGKYEIGFLILFTSYFSTVWESMRELADVSEDVAIAKNAISRMQTILNTPITIDSEKRKLKFPRDWQTLSVDHISFSYENKKVLNDLSFQVKRGEKVGIVGLSGAGKSTLFKLLLKERESYEGEIRFDSIPLKKISKKDYFNHLAVVLQDTELFNASLRDNVTITNPKEESNKQQLKKAIEIAHVDGFMKKLPQGLDSIIGEKGVKLSGGEKQRVGIARAIFKSPQILLLDEATSHLDIESEEKIRDSLHRFFKNVTAIVIAHRLTTIKEMDRIIVVENGSILESGDFDGLYAKKGRFYELWEKQRL